MKNYGKRHSLMLAVILWTPLLITLIAIVLFAFGIRPKNSN
ncbi:MAG TPA: hypothetical protein VJX68_14365 [Candidatus Binatus sp.]|nr:hypothetical protein [Candidatus Binatus sp.]HKN14371.1 hypothetical protein [Candidatus Binatus sp.]